MSWSMRPALPLVVVSLLLCLGLANITSRATWREVEDGVLWTTRAEDVVAAEIAPGSSAERTGVRRGDVLISIDDRPVEQVADVVDALHEARLGTTLRYNLIRLGTNDVIDVRLEPLPGSPGALYFVLA